MVFSAGDAGTLNLHPAGDVVAGDASAAAGTLIPGLPDDLSAVILASLPLPHQSRLAAVCRRWRALLSPSHLLPLRRRLRLPRRQLLLLFAGDPSLSPPLLFDTVALAWKQLPSLPLSPQRYGLANFASVALGPRLFLLGGSLFDARSYPLGHPLPSPAVRFLDLAAPPPLAWARLPDMRHPRGSFAVASLLNPSDENCELGRGGSIIVAGGGSRHPMFPSEGSRTCAVERYDLGSGEWRAEEGLPRLRAGCVGFVVRRGEAEEEEFWVMGGYGDYRPVGGVVPSDVYYRDAVVLGLRSGKWREVGEMWQQGERAKLGAVVVVEGEDGLAKGVFMLDVNDIFRYDFALNRWLKECSLRRKLLADESCGFVAMNGELYVLTIATQMTDAPDSRRTPKKRQVLEMQVYDPERKKWRFLASNPPFHHPIDFKTAVVCTVQL